MQRLVLMGVTATLLVTCTSSRVKVASQLSPQSMDFLGRPATAYGAAGSQPWVSLPAGHVARQWVATLPPETQTRTRHDPAMDALAHVVAIEAATHETTPSFQLEAWLAWKVGVTAPHATCQTGWAWSGRSRGNVDLDAARAASAQLMQDNTLDNYARAGKNLTGPGVYAVGAASVQFTQARRAAQAMALCWVSEHATFSPIPKLHSPSSPLTVQGRAGPGCTVRGRLETSAASAMWVSGQMEQDGTFSVPFATAATPGTYFLQIQVRAPDTKNWRTAMIVPLYVGVPEPAGMSPQDEALLLDQRPAQEWNELIVDALNAWRATNNKPALKPSPGLALLARARLGGDEKAGNLGAKVPGNVAVTGWSSTQKGSAGEALWSLAHDPGPRTLMMATDATHVGVAFEPRKTGYEFLIIVGGPSARPPQKSPGDAGASSGKPFKVSARIRVRDGGGIMFEGFDAGVQSGAPD